jgi:uncharacterized membrane protein
MDLLRDIITATPVLIGWGVLVVASLVALVRDLRRNNPEIVGLMKAVWILTVAYSGPIGLAVYGYSGRKQIRRDSIWRRGLRSTAHCYSGCGAGEIVGVVIAAGILSLGTWPVAITSFALAYLAGVALTIGPLMQEGVRLGTATWDAVTTETASITVMEVVAIGVDLFMAGSATAGQALFWASLALSLTVGFVAAFPVNVILIRLGIKAGMHSPKEHAAHHGS